MSRHYSPKTFLRTVRRPMLRKYFAFRSVTIDVPEDIGKRTDIEGLHDSIEQLPPPQRKQIEQDLAEIGELATPAGSVAILQQAALLGRSDIAHIFGQARNHHERSLWTFLNERRLFEAASIGARMDRVAAGRWRRRLVDQGLPVTHDAGALERFTSQVRQLYARDGRGRYCVADYYLRQEPERHCIYAYPEDYACSELVYDEAGQLRRKSHKPTMDLVCVYRPKNGQIEILAPGGRECVDELANIFAGTILGLPTPIGERSSAALNLDVLKDRSFDFPTSPEDGIDAVAVDELRLKVQTVGKKEVVFRARSTPSEPQAVHNLLEQIATDDNVRTRFAVIGASLKFRFAGEDGRPAKRLRFTLAAPDACSLKDDHHEQIAKKYLREWGIAQDGPVANAPAVRRCA